MRVLMGNEEKEGVSLDVKQAYGGSGNQAGSRRKAGFRNC